MIVKYIKKDQYVNIIEIVFKNQNFCKKSFDFNVDFDF